MRYPCNHVCFPCRRSARAGFVSPSTRCPSHYPPVPTCPSCGSRMLEWRGQVPKREKDWKALETRMSENHQWYVERASPFHPEHFLADMRYGCSDPYAGLMGNACAPEYFRGMTR